MVQMLIHSCRSVLGIVAVIAVTAGARAQTATLSASHDTTIYDLRNGTYNSNGAGQYMFAGKNNESIARRAIVRFDLSTIPAGSTITGATLRLNMSRARANNDPSYLHRMTSDWGEGTSDAPNDEGQGTTPSVGDATWKYAYFGTIPWASLGGDFVSTPSASTVIGGQNGYYTWSGAGVVADAQSWLDSPATNFGWVLRGNETADQTAMRFDTRENPTIANRPQLTVTYTLPPTLGACCATSGACSTTDSAACLAQGGVFQGSGTSCAPNPCPQPTGACCLPGNSCQVLTQAQCSAQTGTYGGNGSGCTPNPCAGVVTASVTAASDNTLYEVASGDGELSNGQGSGFFAGGGDSQNPTYRRRGVVLFDLSAIPTGAVVSDASMQLSLGFTQDGSARTVGVHRALASWGEGASTAAGNQSNGAPAQSGDATWLYRFYSTDGWGTPGGDFVAAPSGTASVGIVIGTFHTWGGAGVVSDVQAWVSNPTANKGWVVISADETTRRTQRRYDSSENATESRRPMLTVTYTIPAATGACCLANASCVIVNASQCAAQQGTYQGNDSSCASTVCPLVLTPFVDALPRPAIAQPVTGVPGGAAHYEFDILEVMQQLHRDLPMTRVWGYAGSYPGPTIEARTGQPVTTVWRNRLRVFETQQPRTTHALPVDTCLHGPDMTGSVPVVVTHIHGGKVAPDSDGDPDLAFPPGQDSPTYHWPNIQPAGTVWYHDHALGITRLNVYMGLAGFYLIRDSVEDALNLPSGEFEIAMAIQDRSINPDGSLKYPDMWMDHFFGDFILVNGKIWPYLNVKQGKYRFRLLNGSGSRTYRLALSNGATFWQIGTDVGLLPGPVPLTELVITPGERADVIVDFGSYAPGTEIVLTNSAPGPFPNGDPATIVPNVMKFIVQDQPGHGAPIPATLAPFSVIPPTEAAVERPLVLRRSEMSGHCPSQHGGMWMINDLMWDDITEFPEIGTTEIWSWINRSGMVHPMHMHLVRFQVLDRQAFDVVNNVIVPTGPVLQPAANEFGWKDTVQAMPNQITRVIARFDTFTGLYPYHCHILEHEDHEMMRQFQVICNAATVATPPNNTKICASGIAVLTVVATGSATIAYQWQIEDPGAPGVWLPTTDGPVVVGSTVLGVAAGSQTAQLTFQNTQRALRDVRFRCAVTNPCGATSSQAATVTICGADFNCDSFVSIDDLFLYFNAYFTGDPAADFNGVGGVTIDDLFLYINAYFVGC